MRSLTRRSFRPMKRFERIGEPSFETPESEQAPERRAYPRHEYRVDVVWMFGLDPTGGVTLDISAGGVLISLAAPVSDAAEGHTCGVHFLNAGEELRPHYVVGLCVEWRRLKKAALSGSSSTLPLRHWNFPEVATAIDLPPLVGPV